MKIFNLLVLILFFNFCFSQTLEKFTTPGTYIWVCPDNVTEIRVQCWGAGGGGGGSNINQYIYGGQGGGGGAYSESTLNVTPRKSYYLKIGTGGTGGLGSTLANDGNDTWFNFTPSSDIYEVISKGGKAGINASGPNTNNLNGGKSNECVGQIKFNGGNGDKGSSWNNTPTYGSGGSSGSYENNGNDGNGRYGAIAPTDGGNGGGGSDGYYDGKNGSFPGGGGGGSIYHSIYKGGGGGDGQIIISYHYSKTINVCDSYTDYNGKIYTLGGVYNVNIKDTAYVLNLSIRNKTFANISINSCTLFLAPNGTIFTKSGTYTITIPNNVGCDSIITLNLTIKDPTYSTLNPILCDSYKAPNGQIFTNSGIYNVTIPNKDGCDSIITINLTIKKKSFSTITKSVCDFYTSPSGKVFTKSGTYSVIIPNKIGCDSIITLNLTINTLKLGVIGGITACPGDEVTLLAQGASFYYWDKSVINGIPFIPSKTDIYTVIGEDLNGCRDTSTVKVNLLNPISIQILNKNKDFICQGNTFELTSISQNVSHYQWKLNGLNIDTIGATSSNLTSKKAGDYSLIVKSDQGCSATSNILTVHITPRPTINTIHTQTICLGDKIQLIATNANNYLWSTGNKNGDYVTPTSSSKYIVTTIDSVSGCVNSDSMFVKVNLPTKSTINTTSLGTFTLNNISYDKSSQYVQTLKNSIGCDSTITLNLVVENLGLNNLEDEKLKIYPNPTPDGKFFIQSDYEIDEIRILNNEGKVLDTLKNEKEIDVSKFGRGVYFVEVFLSKNRVNTYKLTY